MITRTKYSLLLFITVFFAACQKSDNTPPDPSKVSITASPAAGTIYHTGDTVNMVATFSYISELHGVAITITDSASGEEIFEADQDLHTDHFNWQQSWVDTFSQPATLQIKYIGFITDQGEQGNKTITVYTHP